MSHPPRGPTRAALQPACKPEPVQNSIRLQCYFNGARELVLQGEPYYAEGEVSTAYVYLKRFLYLAVEGIPSHKDYPQKRYTRDRDWLARERQRMFPMLERISRDLDEADIRSARAKAAAAAGAAQTQNKNASAGGGGGGWWDNLPEAPTGDPSLSATSRPQYSIAKPPASGPALLHSGPPGPAGVTPSAPPADEAYDWGVGGAGVGYGYGDVGGGAGAVGGVARGGVGGRLAVQDAFSSLSVDQGTPAAGYYPDVDVPGYQRERPSMRPGASIFGVKRHVVLPSTLVAEFERIAQPNTDKPPYGIETCGILAGRLSHNVLEMTTLIIPKQEGTPNSCGTTDETGLFNYMLANKLITLGWIHTHPKQECFMSSVDVHTHCGYQLMLPEAVAVVYAPCDNKKRVGVFRLTQPEGMKLIQECRLKGFHVHPDGVTIYENADLKWSPVGMTVVDMR